MAAWFSVDSSFSSSRVPPGKNKLTDKPPKKPTCTKASPVRCVCASTADSGLMVECESCSKWCHSKCVGITQATAPTFPFVCPFCVKSLFTKLVNIDLVIEDLRTRVSSMEASLAQCMDSNSENCSDSLHSPLAANNNAAPTTDSHLSPSQQPSHRSEVNTTPNTQSSTRRYNIVVSGIDESPRGTSKTGRLNADVDAVTTILSDLASSTAESLSFDIRDCRRLGRYQPNSQKPRSLLVTLNSALEVSFILSNCHQTQNGLSIRPNLSLSERRIRGILLKERRKLIDSEVPRKDIKLRKERLYMSGTLVGRTSIQIDEAMGGNGIPPIILKGTATATLEPLQHIFQLCVKHSTLPKEWRDHYITPIFKSGNRSLVSNYRPISLLSSVSKLFEKLVFDKLFKFLIDTSISNSQNRSVVKQLLIHTKSIIDAFDRNLQLDTILLDVKKAFDTVPHNILLTKLWDLGVVGSLWRLLRSYLTGRRQCVAVNGEHSGWLPVLSGVPQGSILGPLLFVAHINDLPTFISFSNTLLFADDTKLSKAVSSSLDCSHLQQDIQALQKWSSLSFNVAKSFLLRLRLHSNENDGIRIVLCLFYASVYTETNRILIELYGNENGVQSVSF